MRAVPAPMPLAAPVITATLPSSRPVIDAAPKPWSISAFWVRSITAVHSAIARSLVKSRLPTASTGIIQPQLTPTR